MADGDHGRIDETGEQINGLVGFDGVPGTDTLGGCGVERTGEYRQPLEQSLFGLAEQLEGPVDDGAQCLLSGRHRPRPCGQQAEPVVQPLNDLGDVERPHARGGELDRQWQAVQAPAHLRNPLPVCRPELEVGPHRLGAV